MASEMDSLGASDAGSLGASERASLGASDTAMESFVSSQFKITEALLFSASEVPLVFAVRFSLLAKAESIESLLSSGIGPPWGKDKHTSHIATTYKQ